jgi:membrane-associated phospholipid phosphatase
MSAVISVCVVWMAAVLLLGFLAVLTAPRVRMPRRLAHFGRHMRAAVDGSAHAAGRPVTSIIVLLACWAVVIIVGCLLGIVAHRLQGALDEPALRWWQSHHLSGAWTTAWKRLTNIGSPTLTLRFAIIGAVVLFALYFRLRYRWLPSVLLVLAYFATKYAQTIVKATVNRGHPPTSLGSWPSGGVSRVIVIYGLIVFFLILRFRPQDRRTWLVGVTLIAVLATIQAYARIYNLEHWVTDVIGGFLFGSMLLTTMILGYLTWAGSALRPRRPVPE